MAKKKEETKVEVNEETTTCPATDAPSTVAEQEIKMENGPAETTPETDPIQQLGQQVLKLQQERDELIEKIKYSQAELVSYRMRKDEETANLLKYASQDLISELIPLIDNFESAIKLASKSDNPEVSKYLTGFQLMYNTFVDVLKKYGEVFDPKQEQAMVAESDPSKPDEVVLEVLQKGYKLKDRVIRPASVKINQL